eukprot:gene3946-4928_t
MRPTSIFKFLNSNSRATSLITGNNNNYSLIKNGLRYYSTTTTTATTISNNNENTINKKEIDKEYKIYSTQTVITYKDIYHSDLILSQLKSTLPICKWKLQKDNKRLVLGHIALQEISDFNSNSDRKNNKHVGFLKQVLPNSVAVRGSSKEWVDIIVKRLHQHYKQTNKVSWEKWRIHCITPSSAVRDLTKGRGKIVSEVLKELKYKVPLLYKSFNHQSLENDQLPWFENNNNSNNNNSNNNNINSNNEILVQILIEEQSVGARDAHIYSGYFSISTVPFMNYFRNMISNYPGGIFSDIYGQLRQFMVDTYVKRRLLDSPDLDRDTIRSEMTDHFSQLNSTTYKQYIISRSFIKLVELEKRYPKFFNLSPKHTVADLGSSPGGWTYYCLLKQTNVISIDKAPLDEMVTHLMDLQNTNSNNNNNNDKPVVVSEIDEKEKREVEEEEEEGVMKSRYIKWDAFLYKKPTHVFDFLLIDMKVPPIKTLELLMKWLKFGNCRHFVVSLKYEKGDDIPLHDKFIKESIEPLTQFLNSCLLESSGEREITLFGTSNKTTK